MGSYQTQAQNRMQENHENQERKDTLQIRCKLSISKNVLAMYWSFALIDGCFQSNLNNCKSRIYLTGDLNYC